ncbi:MAG: hypothetical protein HZB82_03385 [Deltaproteobacteria bacterium]|nr:hypothetical protein [Deltaproteobacteria bacterium]
MQNANDALLKAIEEDAFAESERLVKEAVDAASAIAGEAEAEVKAEREERLGALYQGFERRRASAVNNARIRVNAQKLMARREAVEEVLSGLLTDVGRMPDAEYAALLTLLFKELERAWKEGSASEPVVLAGAREAGLLAKAGIAAGIDPAVSLGVVFKSKDGRLRFENTIHSRIEKAGSVLVMELNRHIFG